MSDLDQFFTPEQKAIDLINVVNSKTALSTYDNIIEPSAGSGAFFKNLPKNSIGVDLEPHCEGVIKKDFFDFKFPKGRNLTIGNPPYGKRGSLALKFINKAADYSDTIAFVLPRGFMRSTLQNSIDQRLHLTHSEMLDTFELPDGAEYKVKSVFQIWEKKPILREKIIEPKEHPDFDLLHKHISWISSKELNDIKEEYPYAIGQNKMRIEESKNISKGSIWFLKPNKPNVKEIFETATFESAYWTTGAPSLSKGDIINGYIAASEK